MKNQWWVERKPGFMPTGPRGRKTVVYVEGEKRGIVERLKGYSERERKRKRKRDRKEPRLLYT